MKTVKIPNDYHPYVVEVNGKVYEYPEGTEQTVPDEVAEVIGNRDKLQPIENEINADFRVRATTEDREAYVSKYSGAEIDAAVAKAGDLSKVTANPTLAGTEAALTGLEVGETKYKVEQPINVVANPTLAGTEAALTGLQVGETKYKVSGGGEPYYVDFPALSSISATLGAFLMNPTTEWKSKYISISDSTDKQTLVDWVADLIEHKNSNCFIRLDNLMLYGNVAPIYVQSEHSSFGGNIVMPLYTSANGYTVILLNFMFQTYGSVANPSAVVLASQCLTTAAT